MGLFKKIKNIFYDEEIIEDPIKEEKIEEEDIVIKPRIEEVVTKKEESQERESTFSERELFKPERTFNFPAFDDEDEKEEERPTRSVNILELEKRRTSTINSAPGPKTPLPERNEEKIFRPSPVISPIYGILDKNYKKEEIKQKKEDEKRTPNEMSYDYVRRKAYGTLEEELENTLTSVTKEVKEQIDDIEDKIEELEKPTEDIENLLTEIQTNANLSIGELEEAAKDKMLEDEEDEVEEYPSRLQKEELEEEEEIEEKPAVGDETLEHDLFNLIDSMYDKDDED